MAHGKSTLVRGVSGKRYNNNYKSLAQFVLSKKRSEISQSDWVMQMLRFTNVLNVQNHNVIKPFLVIRKMKLNVNFVQN